MSASFNWSFDETGNKRVLLQLLLCSIRLVFNQGTSDCFAKVLLLCVCVFFFSVAHWLYLVWGAGVFTKATVLLPPPAFRCASSTLCYFCVPGVSCWAEMLVHWVSVQFTGAFRYWGQSWLWFKKPVNTTGILMVLGMKHLFLPLKSC